MEKNNVIDTKRIKTKIGLMEQKGEKTKEEGKMRKEKVILHL
jgi:hypothetical protein